MTVGMSPCVSRPQDAADAAPEQIDEPYGVRVRHRRRSGDDDLVAPPVAAPVDPEVDLAVVDVDDVGEPVAVDIADEDTARVVVEWEAGRVVHRDAAAPQVPYPQFGQYSTFRSWTSTMSISPSPDMSDHLTRGSEKVTFGKASSACRSTKRVSAPPVVGGVEVALESCGGAQCVGHTVAGQIEESDLRVFEIEGRRRAW